MPLKITAIGTGVCADTPHTVASRQPPGFLVQIDDAMILLDCSQNIRLRLKTFGVDIAAISHVAVSHSHPDHAALPQFIQERYCRLLFGEHDPRTTDVRIFLPRILARDFPQVWNWHQPENDGKYWNEFEPKIIGLVNGDVQEIVPGTVLRAIDVYHGYGRHPAMGFRIETPYGVIGYTGDAGICDGVRAIAKDTDLYISDCSTRVGQEYTGGYGHMGPRQCGEVALQAKTKELWLTHYFDFDTPEAMSAEVRAAGFFGETKIATDGLVWQRA